MTSAASIAAVTQDYTIELLRTGSSSEINSWASAIDAGFLTVAQVASAIANSAESTMFVVPVEQIYAGILGRVADAGGLNANANALRAGTSVNTLVGNLVGSQEFANDYAGGGALSTINPAAFVTVMYNDFLGRSPDQAGLAGWVAKLAVVNANNLAGVIEGFLFSQEYSQDSGNPIVQYLANSGIAGTYAATILGLPGPAGGGTTGQSTFTLTTAVDHVNNFTTVFGDITPFIANGIGPTLNQGDTVSNVTNVVITDQFANQQGAGGGGLDIIPDGAVFTNVKNITLNTDANAGNNAFGGGVSFDVAPIAGVALLTVTSIGAGVDEDNAGPTTAIVELQNSPGLAAGTQITGGSTVTVTSKGGGGVAIGSSAGINAGVVPPASELPSSTVVVNELSTSTGGVSVMGGKAAAGGTAVTINISSPSNTGAVNIGNDGPNSGNNPVAGYVNPVGAVAVTDAGVGFITSFGGTNIVINSAAGGVVGVVQGVTVGDATATVASNQPSGTITITDKAVATYDSLNNTAFFVQGTHNFVAAPDSAFGGTVIAITTNAGAANVGTGNAIPTTLPSGNVTIIDTANNAQALSEAAGSAISVQDPIAKAAIGGHVGILGTIANTDADVAVYGGVNISVMAANANVFVGTNNAGVTVAGALPTGTVSVIETLATTQENVQGIAAAADNVADGLFGGGQAIAQTEYAVNIDGGNGVTVAALGQNVFIGANLGTAGAQVITQSAVLTGDGLSNPGGGVGAGNGAIVDNGGTTVSVTTTGGAVTIGSATFNPSGTVSILDTFGAGNATNDPINVMGAFTGNSATTPNAGVTITTTPDKAPITVGTTPVALANAGVVPGSAGYQSQLQVLALNAGRTGLAAPNLYPVSNVTIVDSQTNGATTTYGKGAVSVFSNGATAVSITGGAVANVVDVEAIKATSGKSIGTSSLNTVIIDGTQAGGGGAVAVQSDALATLTILDNTTAVAYTVIDGVAGPLTLGLGNDTTSVKNFPPGVSVTDATTTAVTVTDNGKADTTTVNLLVVAATTLTVNNTAAATLNLAGDTALTSIALTGSGAVTLMGTGALTALTSINGSKSSGSITAAVNPAFTSFVGGIGGTDIVTITANASTFAAGVKLTGGVGTTDVLVANYASASSDIALGNDGSVITGFEVFGLGPAAISAASTKYDANGFIGAQIGGFGVNGAGAASFSLTGDVVIVNAANNPSLTITQDTGLLATPRAVSFSGLNTGATTDALTLNLGTNSATAPLNIHLAAVGAVTATGPITANAYENVTINSLGSTLFGGANSITLNDLPSAGSATLTVTGNSGLILNDPNSFFTSLSVNSADTSPVNFFKSGALGNVVFTSNVGASFTGGGGALTAAGSTAAGTEVIAVNFSSTGGAATPFNVGDIVTLNVANAALTTGETYTATVSGAKASDADLAAAFQAAVLNNPTTPTTFTDVADGATVTVMTAAIGGGGLGAGFAATASGSHLVLTANNGVYYQSGVLAAVANTGTGTVVQTINSGAEEQLLTVLHNTAGETFKVTLTAQTPGGAATFTTAASAVPGTENAFTDAQALATVITAAETAFVTGGGVPIISGATAVHLGDGTAGVVLSGTGSVFFNTSGLTVGGGGAAGDLTAGVQALTYGAVIDSFTTGAGGGTYTLGIGGAWDNTVHALSSGSEAVNLTASAAVVDQINVPDGAIASGSTGGVTGFATGVVAGDKLNFVTAAGAAEPKTILTNTSATNFVSTVANSAAMANILDPSGALATAIGGLDYTISNGIITFTGNVNSLSTAQKVAAAEILVSSGTNGPAGNAVAAFSDGTNTWVVASDPAANTLFTGPLNSNDAVVELKGLATPTGFSSAFGQGTIEYAVNAGVPDINRISNPLSPGGGGNISTAATFTQDDTGFSLQLLNGVGGGAASLITLNNLAPGSSVQSAATGTFSLTTTQTGPAGLNSLVYVTTSAQIVNTLTVTGDGQVVFAPGAFALTVGTLVDGGATPTLTSIAWNGTAGSTTDIQAINDSALTSINPTSAGGAVTIGDVTPLSQPNLTVTDGSGASAGVQLTLFASAASVGDTIKIGTITAPNGAANAITAAGATTAITIDGGGNNAITANGTGDTIIVGDNGTVGGVAGVNIIGAAGSGDTITFLGVQALGTAIVTVGSNATVTFGDTTTTTLTGVVALAGGHNEQITVSNALTGAPASGAFAFTTVNGAADNANHNQQIFFGAVGAAHEGLAGATVEASLVNVASVSTLAAALNLAATSATTAVQPNPSLPGFAQLQPGDGVIDWFQFQGNTYIEEVVNPTAVAASHAALAATDIVVKLVGLVDIGANGIVAANGFHQITLSL